MSRPRRPSGGAVSPPAGSPRSGRSKVAHLLRQVAHVISSAVRRRRRLLILALMLYFLGTVMFMGSFNLNDVRASVGVSILKQTPPGSIYRSPLVFKKLWPYIHSDTNHSNSLMTAWHQRASQKWKPCLNQRLLQSEFPPSNGYLIIEANGGLNQQRISICDAVAVAGLLNATLVIPIFQLNSVWHDPSKFGNIFDEEYFIEALKNHVRVVIKLPEDILLQFDNDINNIVNMRTKALASRTYYLQKVLPKLLEAGAVRIAPFFNRLAHSVPSHMQGLRCLSNFDALRFSQPIRVLAEKMVERMVMNSSMSGGKYIAVHLRFEKDMVAFSCCSYDGGEKEKQEMDNARERNWRGKFKRPHRKVTPEANRMNGKCPLTPLEVGMMLRGMGFDNSTSVYVASGKIYNAEKFMAPFRQLFPRLETKETLASADELALFKDFSSRLAALDYTVSAHSEVFVTTQGGNFPHFLMGHRRYMYEGHAKTIKPDKRKLVLLFDNPNIRWERFKANMQEVFHESDRKGVALRKANASLYTFPMPDCMCQQTGA